MPVSLHTHSWYSLLEGASSPAALVARAVEGGHRALALTDTNNLCGAVAFVELARQAGLRPIVGARLRHGGQSAVALAADRDGYRNLCRVISAVMLAEAGVVAPLVCEDGEESGRNEEGELAKREAGSPSALTPHPLSTGGEGDRMALTEILATHHEGLHVLADDPALAEGLLAAFRGRLWLEVVRPGDPRREQKLR